jgi:hypothetical protein
MKSVTYDLHSFSELSPLAQQQAIADYRSNGHQDFDLFDDQFLLRDFRDQLGLIGLDKITINYTGFSSQGDGLSFIAQVADIPLFLSSIGYTPAPDPNPAIAFGKSPREYNEMDITFWSRSNTLYRNERTVDTLIDINDTATDHGPLYDAVEAWRLAKCLDMYSQLEALYSESTGDAAIAIELELKGEVYLETGVLLVNQVNSEY